MTAVGKMIWSKEVPNGSTGCMNRYSLYKTESVWDAEYVLYVDYNCDTENHSFQSLKSFKREGMMVKFMVARELITSKEW